MTNIFLVTVFANSQENKTRKKKKKAKKKKTIKQMEMNIQ